MVNIFERYKKKLDRGEILENIAKLKQTVNQENNVIKLKNIFQCIDFTSLNTDDNDKVITAICHKMNDLPGLFPSIPPVAALCVYPPFVETARKHLTIPGINIASVAGGFPSSQTFTEIKISEASMAVEAGAQEIDIVIPAGRFLNGEFIEVAGEIGSIKREIKPALLKVILETSLLGSPENIRNAALLAMHAGADFIKTSTGKGYPGADFLAVYIMADAAGDFYRGTGGMVGIKPSGGIVDSNDALVYQAIVTDILGEKWGSPGLFRIGASRLANNLINLIMKMENQKEADINYF